jgi:hypothetical protein
MSEPIFFDRTRVVTDWKCRRRRFWAFEFMGKGISPKRRALALDLGIVMHEVLASLLTSGDLEEVVHKAVAYVRATLTGDESEVQDAKEWKIREQCAMIEGMIRGWHKIVLPRLLADYRVVHVEGEVLYDYQGCRLGSKPDVLLERVSDGTLWYIEWKTTGIMSPKWFASWHKAVQVPAGVLGVAQTLGKTIAGSIIFALNKGRMHHGSGRQESIFAYGYGLPSIPHDLGYEYRRGLWRHPAWEICSTKQWVEEMPLRVLESQFGDTGPVFIQAHLVERWLAQTAFREKEIRSARDQIFGGAPLTQVAVTEVLDRYFPQNFGECEPVIGSACGYRDVCFLRHIERDPIASGLYLWREPHHTTDPNYVGEED